MHVIVYTGADPEKVEGGGVKEVLRLRSVSAYRRYVTR